MTVADRGNKVRSGEGKTPIIPLPPPPPVRLVSILFALAAAVAGFLGFSRTAAIFASISLGTNVLDYVTNNNRQALDSPASTGDRAAKTTPVG
jgi:hypothetical protein